MSAVLGNGRADAEAARPSEQRERALVPSEIAFLRFAAGCRALLATLTAIGLLVYMPGERSSVVVLVLPYLVWSGVLLWRTLAGWPLAASRWWFWVDAAVLVLSAHWMADSLPMFGISTILPVVALALLAGAVPAIFLALACVVALLLIGGWPQEGGGLPGLSVTVPLLLLVASPAAALLTRPSRDLRERMVLVESFSRQSDPRHGLQHHVDALLGLLGRHFGLGNATLRLQGPEPRIFQWQPARPALQLEDPELGPWRQRLEALPADRGCVYSSSPTSQGTFEAVDPASGSTKPVDDATRIVLRDIGPQALTLPLRNYGQPLGTLCLKRDQPPFTAAEAHWLHDVMREAMPLLERADLLEQLQRESAARERERIGRDLHDSAVQPYLGLKYGLEALARQAGSNNPVSPNIQQLLRIANDELHTLRDVVSGLRSGVNPTQQTSPVAALERQAVRFQELFGLKVNVFAGQAPRLRGAVGKAVLLMFNEALTNIRRHTSATAVTVMVDVQDRDLVMRVRNDHGYGEALPKAFVPRSLTERAAEFRGSIAVNHEADFTEMTITLPLIASIV
jgi:signal transduction histidine kinase